MTHPKFSLGALIACWLALGLAVGQPAAATPQASIQPDAFAADSSLAQRGVVSGAPASGSAATAWPRGPFNGEPVYVANAGQIGRTFNISSTLTVWQNITPAAVGSIYNFELDSHYPDYQAWVAASTGIWRTKTLNAAAPTWQLVVPLGAMNASALYPAGKCTSTNIRKVIVDPTRPGRVMFFAEKWDSANSVCPVFQGTTEDGGASWHYQVLPTCLYNNSQPTVAQFAKAVDLGRDGRMYLAQFHSHYDAMAVGYRNRVYVFRSDDAGRTWSRLPEQGYDSGAWGHPSAVTSLYVSQRDPALVLAIMDAVNQYYPELVLRTVNGGSSWTTGYLNGIHPSVIANALSGFVDQAGSEHIFAPSREDYAPGQRLFYSPDGGATWTHLSTLPFTYPWVNGIGSDYVVNPLNLNEQLSAQRYCAGAGCTNNTAQASVLKLFNGVAWADITGDWYAKFGGKWLGGDVSLTSPAQVRKPTCVTYDFTQAQRHFEAADGAGQYLAPRGFYSYGSAQPAQVTIDRGLHSGDLPLVSAADGLSNRLLAGLTDSADPRPLEKILVTLDWVSPLQAGAQVSVAYQLQAAGLADLVQGVQVLPVTTSTMTAIFKLDPPVFFPTGLGLSVQAAAGQTAVRLRAAAVCVNTPPYADPPPSADSTDTEHAACDALFENIAPGADGLGRRQPFGSQGGAATPSQPELPAEASGVSLEPYPAFRFHIREGREDYGYHPALQYTSAVMSGYTVVPCRFQQGEQIYNPAGTAPMVRFTVMTDSLSLSDTLTRSNQMREWLTLLNYAGYYAYGTGDPAKPWCYEGDRVFESHYWFADDSGPERWALFKPGYSVPAPQMPCAGADTSPKVTGPCASLAASVQRAMGYFNVDALAEAYTTVRPNLANIINYLYYNALGYDKHVMPDNSYNGAERIFVRVDNGDPTVYLTHPVEFSQLRVTLPADPLYTDIDNELRRGAPDLITCRQSCAALIANLTTFWTTPGQAYAKTLLGTSKHGPGMTAADLWAQIKPGDFAVSLAPKTGSTDGLTNVARTTHVQVVVGWGPNTANVTPDIYTGQDLYPTYFDIPSDLQASYVPYVIERVADRQPTALQPRPFHAFQRLTAVNFWVANYPVLEAPAPAASSAAISQSGQPAAPLEAAVAASATLQLSSSAAWSPDGNWIAVGGGAGVRLYTPELTPTVHLAWVVTPTAVADLSWSPDSARLAGALADSQVAVWEAQTGRQLAALTEVTGTLTSVAWSPDGSRIAASSAAGGVGVWAADSFMWLYAPVYTGTPYIHALAWSPDGQRLAGSDDTGIYLWEAQTGQLLASFPNAGIPGWSLEWTPDGQSLVTPGPRVWNTLTGETTELVPCSAGTDTYARLSPDGSWLASAGGDLGGNSACLNHLEAGYVYSGVTYLDIYPALDTLADLTWSPNGQRLALVTQSGWLHVWDPIGGTLLATAAYPNVALAEIDGMVAECVAHNGPLDYDLSRKVYRQDFAGLVNKLKAQPAGTLSTACARQLITIGEYFMRDPLLDYLYLPLIGR